MSNTELIARLRTLIGEYWDIGYTEGKNGMANAEAANAKWHDIDAALQSLERVPMTEEVALKLAHRRATTYTHRSDPHYSGYAFVPYTLMDFVRDLEAHHGITPPENKG